MRQFTVVGPEREITIYEGFNHCSGDSDFKLVPAGMIESIDGAFYCKTEDLAVAVSELNRYNQEMYGRMGRCVKVTQIF